MGSAAYAECPHHAPKLLVDTMEDMNALYDLLPRKAHTFSTFMVSTHHVRTGIVIRMNDIRFRSSFCTDEAIH
jgi:hypothetical protein